MSTNYSISEEYILPSRGKIYSQKVNPVVKLRSMTTNEEMKRLAPSERSYQSICEIIDDCLVEKIGISAYDMCLSDYQYLLHKLRVVTYGPEYTVTATCPHCLTTSEKTINLDEIEVTEFDEEKVNRLLEFELPQSGKKIHIVMQTPRMIDDVDLEIKERRKKSKNKNDGSAFLLTVASFIDTIDGKNVNPLQKEEFVRNLPMMDTNYIVKYAQKLVESFGLNTSLDLTCDVCGLDYTSPFRITAEFFGPSVDI